MKFVYCLIIDKKYFSKDDISDTVKHIETYINNIDHLIIYNISGENIDELKYNLSRFENISYSEGTETGEVYDFHNALKLCFNKNCDFASIMKIGYYYEESAVNNLKKYAINNPDTCVITPMPVFSCEEHTKSEIDSRTIMGCHLIGALINIKDYCLRGFKEKFYRSCFDYEYCLYHRSLGKKVVLLPNEILRNTNYIVKERSFLFFKTQFYDRDLLDVYYETRNRMYIWKEYENIDPEYVRLDKKEFKKEVKEMRLKDKNFGDKKLMINRAKTDFLLGKTGKRNFKY